MKEKENYKIRGTVTGERGGQTRGQSIMMVEGPHSKAMKLEKVISWQPGVMKSLILIIIAISLFCGYNPRLKAEPRLHNETVPKDRWVRMLESVFSNAKLRLNNYTSHYGKYYTEPEKAFYWPDNSYLEITLPSGRVKWPINTPPDRYDPSTIYISDINSESIRFDARNRLYIVEISFEDEWPEVMTNCVKNFWCGAIGDRKVNIESPSVSIAFRPSVESGRLSYSNVYVDLTTSSTTISGCSDDLFAFLCDIIIGDKEGFVKEKVESALKRNLEDPATKTALTTVINSYLSHIGVEPGFIFASINGAGDLILTYRD
jgi:hypothetical protein